VGFSNAMHAAAALLAAAALPLATLSQSSCLTNPAPSCNLQAPAAFNVTFNTTVGAFTLHIERQWAPLGVDRFYTLAHYSYFDSSSVPGNDDGFFRVLPGFVVQFGIAGAPAVSAAWENLNIQDDPVLLSNTLGTIAFATAGPNTRTTQVRSVPRCRPDREAHGAAMPSAGPLKQMQVYINLGNNSRLDADGFAPFGMVTEAAGLAVVNKIYSGYGQTPDQDAIYAQGNAYLKASFPLLDYIVGTTIEA